MVTNWVRYRSKILEFTAAWVFAFSIIEAILYLDHPETAWIYAALAWLVCRVEMKGKA